MKQEHKQLDSGLNIYLFQSEQLPITQFQFYTPFGGDTLQYRDGDTGALINLTPGSAHYFEHVLFIRPPEGLKWRTNTPKTQKNLRDSMTIMKQLGAMVPNAYTSYDTTNYWCITRQNQLRILDVLIEGVMQPYLPHDRFREEVGTILDEARRSENEYGSKLFGIFMSQLFQKHGSKKPILGSLEDIKNISLDDVLSMHSTFYAPSNMSLVVVGNQSMDAIINVVEGKLALLGLDDYKAPPKEVIQNEPHGAEIKDNFADPFVRQDVPFPLMYAGWKSMINPLEMTRDETIDYHTAFKIIAETLLAKGSIQRELMIREGMDEAFFGGSGASFRDHGLIYFGGLGTDPERFREILTAPVKKMIKEGIPQEDLEYVRNHLLVQHDRNTTFILELGRKLANWGVLTKDPSDYFRHMERVETMKADEVNSYVKRILDLENLSFALAKPGKK